MQACACTKHERALAACCSALKVLLQKTNRTLSPASTSTPSAYHPPSLIILLHSSCCHTQAIAAHDDDMRCALADVGAVDVLLQLCAHSSSDAVLAAASGDLRNIHTHTRVHTYTCIHLQIHMHTHTHTPTPTHPTPPLTHRRAAQHEPQQQLQQHHHRLQRHNSAQHPVRKQQAR